MGWDNVVSRLYCHHGAFLPPFSSPNCMVIVFTFTFKKDIIIFQLSTIKSNPRKCTNFPAEEWCGSQREMGGLLEFHDQIRTQNVSAPHHGSRQSALACGRRRVGDVGTEAWDDGRTGAQEAESVKMTGRVGVASARLRWWVVVFFCEFCEECDGNTLNLSNDFREKLWVT